MLCQYEKQRLGALVVELVECDDRAIRLTLRRELGLLARYLRCKKIISRYCSKSRKRLKIVIVALTALLGSIIAAAPDLSIDQDLTPRVVASFDDDDE